MAQYRLNAYDADVWIPEFKGLMQYGDQMGTDLRYSPDCMNVETPGGVLQPAPLIKGATLIGGPGLDPTAYFPADNIKKNGTMMSFRGVNIIYTTDAETIQKYKCWREDYLANNWYYYRKNHYLFIAETDRITNATGCLYSTSEPETFDAEPYNCGTWSIGGANITGNLPTTGWSWTVYSIKLTEDKTYSDGIPGHDAVTIPAGTVFDSIIFSHPDYHVESYNPIDRFSPVSTPSKFSFISRYAERIWGLGVGENKDRIYYSRPYSATDWTADVANPANGGGEIELPTWDDDEFTALQPLGNSLIAFSKKRAWKITGTDPSNFVIQEQYGNGTPYPDTIAVFENEIIMMGENGLVRYDGDSVSPFFQEMTNEIFRRVVIKDVKPMATKVDDKYVLALSNEAYAPFTAEGMERKYETGGDATFIDDSYVINSAGYRLIAIDISEGTVLQMDSPTVLSFMRNKPFMLLYTGEGENAHLEYARIQFDSWYEHRITDKATKWVSPWITLGRKDIKKGGFDFYFTPEVEKEKRVAHELRFDKLELSTPEYYVEEHSGSVTFKISIQTESKLKTKNYTVQPLTDEQIAAGKKYKEKRLHFGGSGRRFRVIIETEAGNTIPWRLVGGIHIIAEIDKD